MCKQAIETFDHAQWTLTPVSIRSDGSVMFVYVSRTVFVRVQYSPLTARNQVSNGFDQVSGEFAKFRN